MWTLGQVSPAAGASTTFVALATTGLTVVGGIIVGYLTLLRDKRQKVAQDEERLKYAGDADKWAAAAAEIAALKQSNSDLADRLDRIENRLDSRITPRSRGRQRDNRNTDTSDASSD